MHCIQHCLQLTSMKVMTSDRCCPHVSTVCWSSKDAATTSGWCCVCMVNNIKLQVCLQQGRCCECTTSRFFTFSTIRQHHLDIQVSFQLDRHRHSSWYSSAPGGRAPAAPSPFQAVRAPNSLERGRGCMNSNQGLHWP